MNETVDALASELFGAIERGDVDAVARLYAPNISVWHNLTDKTQTRDENLELLRFFTGRIEGLRYEILGRDFFPGGFVQRHILHGKLASGDALTVPVCIVIYVSADNQIERVFEYLDQAAIQPAFS